MGFVLGAVEGCGSSGSSTPSCNDVCVKTYTCELDASASTATTTCSQICAMGTAGTGGQGTKCTNQSTIDSARNNCFSISDCTMFNECIAKVPTCQMGGAGGANGGAGTSGSAGKGGGAGASGSAGSTGAGGAGAGNCSICDKAQTCCVAAAPLIGQQSSSCTFSSANCTAAGASSANYASGCQTVLTSGAALGVAACQ